jgi:peptidyl-prolyl cis-trans isomerase D
MLQAMRDKVMGVLGWIIIGLIIITFALFGLGSYMQDRSRVYAAKVNGAEITPRELQLAYQQQRAQMEEMLGDAYDPALIDDQLLRKRALDALISRRLLLQAAEENGMAISDQLLAAYIHSASVFQEGGVFSEERYQRLLYQQGQTPAGFEHDTRRRLQVEQLVNGLSQTGFVTDTELAQAYRLQEQTRDFAYWIVSAQPFEAEVKPSEEQIEAYYREHSDDFVVPERVRLAYVRLSADRLAQSIEVDEAELEAEYEARQAALKAEEQRRARHILIQVPEDADEEAVAEARQEAEKLLERIREGADFAELAREYSDDPGSASQGGDLGFFARGVMAPAFEKSVFSLQPGEVSDVVRTPFGFHIIKLVDIRAGEVPSLDEMREELTADLKQRAAEDLFYDELEQLTDLSYENPQSLDVAADALGLEIQHSDWLTAEGGPGIGQYPELISVVFSEDVLEAGNNSEPVEVGPNDVIVARVEEREPTQQLPLEKVRDRVTEALRKQMAAEMAQSRGEDLLEKLAQGTPVEELRDVDQASFHRAESVKRSVSGHNPEVVQQVFTLAKPSEGASVDKGFSLSDGGYAVVHLTDVTDGDPAEMSDEVRAQLRRSYENMRRSVAVSTLVESLRAEADIEVPEEQE